jgi:hypothetical protein
MKTTINNWYLVELITNTRSSSPQIFGEVLWGDIVIDDTCRFMPGDYVCTSLIRSREQSTFLTNSGSSYVCQGKGKLVSVDLKDWDVLRQGVSPSELTNIKSAIRLVRELPSPGESFTKVEKENKSGKPKMN